MKDNFPIPVQLFATTPQGRLPLPPDASSRFLPAGPEQELSDLSYAAYLDALRCFLLRNSGRQIVAALGRRLRRPVSFSEIEQIDIYSEKHGYTYQVARADLTVSGRLVSFALNVAVDESAKASLQKEFRLLQRLHQRFGFSYVPEVYFLGSQGCRQGGDRPIRLAIMAEEWFDGFHEFHLHLDETSGRLRMLLWDTERGYDYLSEEESLGLYRQSSKILSSYYDWNSFKQICPWHHAAGDFVLRQDRQRLDLRLTTVRGYLPVVGFRSRRMEARLLALTLFFLHLTLQMRLDRLDGVGQVVWAPACSLAGVVAGFFAGLEAGGKRKTPELATGILDLFRSFSKGQWLQLLAELLVTYRMSGEEVTLVREHAEDHLGDLQRLLTNFPWRGNS